MIKSVKELWEERNKLEEEAFVNVKFDSGKIMQRDSIDREIQMRHLRIGKNWAPFQPFDETL